MSWNKNEAPISTDLPAQDLKEPISGIRAAPGPTTPAAPGPATRATPGPTTTESNRNLVAAVVSRQRAGLLYWVLVVGAAGLGGIAVLSVLTVLFHRPCGRSQTVDMRHKQPQRGQVNGVHKQDGLAARPADTDRNYNNVCTLAPATTRAADSVISWGSEFEVTAGEPLDNIYSNQYKTRPPNHWKTGNGKPANVDIYVNGIAF